MDFKLPKSGNWTDDYMFIYIPVDSTSLIVKDENKENIKKSLASVSKSPTRQQSQEEKKSPSPLQSPNKPPNQKPTRPISSGGLKMKTKSINEIDDQDKRLDQIRQSSCKIT